MNTEKTVVNYTDEMVQVLRDASPIDYAKAQQLAEQLGKGVRSIIAKCKREEIEYISKPAPAKKGPNGPTKAQLVSAIADGFGVEADSLVGLEKATGNALGKLIAAMRDSS